MSSDLLGIVISIVKTALATVEAVKHNNKSCDYIAECLSFGLTTLKEANSIADKLNSQILERMKNVFERCQEFISTYSNKMWVSKMLNAWKYHDDFKWMIKNIEKIMHEFTVDVGIKHFKYNIDNEKANSVVESDIIYAYAEIECDNESNIFNAETEGRNMNVMNLVEVSNSNVQVSTPRLKQAPTNMPVMDTSTRKNIQHITSDVVKTLKVDPSKVVTSDRLGTIDTSIVGDTYKGKVSGETAIIKVIKLDNDTNTDEDYKFRLEQAQALNYFTDHPHLIKIKNCATVTKTAKWVTEIGIFNLEDLLESNSNIPSDFILTEDLKYDILLAIAKALRHLHMSNIVHGGLKPTNILFCKNTNGKYIVKLSDYVFRHFREKTMTKAVRFLNMKSSYYLAPEQSQHRNSYQIKCTEAADVYSFAKICEELSILHINHSPVDIGIHQLPHTPRGFELRRLIGHSSRGCLHDDPTKRTNIFEVCNEMKKIRQQSNTEVKPLSPLMRQTPPYDAHTRSIRKTPTATPITANRDTSFSYIPSFTAFTATRQHASTGSSRSQISINISSDDIEYPHDSSTEIDLSRHSIESTNDRDKNNTMRPSMIMAQQVHEKYPGILAYMCPLWIVQLSGKDDFKIRVITVSTVVFVFLVTTLALSHVN